MKRSVLLGTHVSISGGLSLACERAARIGCTTMQIFTRNRSRWEDRPLADKDIQSYKTAKVKARIGPVFSHASYLINLCAADRTILRKSLQALSDELTRADMLGLQGVIVHPGSHVGQGETPGLARTADSVNTVHRRTPGVKTLTILETTAGQGTSLGYRIEHLRAILEAIEQPGRVAFCLDTCHLFAAGYPIHTETGWTATMATLDAVIGFSRIVAVHVNDSAGPLGSRRDRHDHIGKGKIGLQGFRMLMNDPRFKAIPKILETDKSADMHEDVENMSRLRALIA
jgi:deoxyribonuclease-4